MAAVAATVLATVAGCGGEGDGDDGMASPGQDGARAEVRELYQQRCSACHGDDGRGASGPSLAGVADRLDRDEIADVVRDGRTGMPAWEGTLTDAEIDAVVAYVDDVVG